MADREWERRPDLRSGRAAQLGNLAGMAAAAGQEARVVAARRRMASVRLTDEERRICFDELAEQFAVGRLDEDELHRRVELVQDAVTHGDLQVIFAGLPVPPLYAQPAPARKPGRWRWAAFVGAVWMALPFFLVGLAFLVFGREIAAAIFGLPALAWVLVTWRWASAPGRQSRRR
ncbi:protein of unknown function DUF1707 [Kribbella flavida DSM 17836]|uniref:DUF1707 domain-containing protein n=1 Tax=Kribbella flavida (strain DSM 17836 / JCM 10339 / NBRC 14399) TaxID=479435 RepID=D2PZU5_KRIFD|nr:DUF1707 domain-containing protein [Kribbella flavida]ADB35661.1 protein of unknown function DUF1707 [Kribbella flavida DSM 17836]